MSRRDHDYFEFVFLRNVAEMSLNYSVADNIRSLWDHDIDKRFIFLDKQMHNMDIKEFNKLGWFGSKVSSIIKFVRRTKKIETD